LTAAVAFATACGGTSEQNFFDNPAQRVVKNGGTGGTLSPELGGGGTTGGTTSSNGGSAGAPINTAGSTATTGGAGGSSGGSGGSVGGDAGTGDTGSVGGSGGSGGDAPVGGLGGTSLGGAGTGGSSGGDAGAGNVGGLAGVGGQAGMTAMGGNAGSPAGGRVGRGGRGGAGGSGDECATLLADVRAKLKEAQACNLAQDSLSCTGLVTDECGCDVPVNNLKSEATKTYRAALDALGDCAVCTEALCHSGDRAYCQSSGNAVDGHCALVGLTTL
jgi:hypothetical protein